MKRRLALPVILAVAAVGVAACGGSSNSSKTTTTTPTAAKKQAQSASVSNKQTAALAICATGKADAQQFKTDFVSLQSKLNNLTIDSPGIDTSTQQADLTKIENDITQLRTLSPNATDAARLAAATTGMGQIQTALQDFSNGDWTDGISAAQAGAAAMNGWGNSLLSMCRAA